MENLDAAGIAQLALRTGLIQLPHVEEAKHDLGGELEGKPAEALLRLLERRGVITPFQSSKLVKGDTDGYFYGGYKVLYKIQSGSFGRVYRAEDPRVGRIVAIKVLRKRWLDNPHQIEMFEREGRVGAKLQHPNIVEVLNVNKDPLSGQYYIIMEFVEGENLREMLARTKKLEPAKALRIIEDAVAGLGFAYARGVTHRDIKLSNILISAQGTAKLVDFGLATLYASAGKEGNKDLGEKVDRTVDYAGLEKATNVKSGDTRSDLYFLGCVLYEMLSGRSPLDMTKNVQMRMHRGRYEKVEPMKKEEVDAPPSVFHLVETMMSLNPQTRYQTPLQLLEAVRNVRREVEGKAGGAPVSQNRSVFLAEPDDRLQEPIKNKFKEMGYRVYMASDPTRALDLFRQKTYDGLVVDAGTTGEDGLLVFDKVMSEADRMGVHCKGILILSEHQSDWAGRLNTKKNVAILNRPITLKQLARKLQELVPLPSPEAVTG